MTYEELKNKYDELVSLGVDVLTLKGDDELTKALRAIGKVKIILDDCAARNIDVSGLNKNFPEYRKVKDIYMNIDGKRVPIFIKFKLAGYDKKVRKAPTYEELKERLDKFVDAGYPIEKLREFDYELYCDIRNSNEKNFEAKSKLFDRLKVLGYKKPVTKVENVEEELAKEIHNFKAQGGDINIDSGEFPFKQHLWATMKKYRRNGNPVSMEYLIRKNGAEEYSEVFVKFRKLFMLSDFRDEEGFVDDFRKDINMNNIIDNYSEKLEIPQSVIVMLIADEKLRRSFINTDVISFTKNQAREFLEKNKGSFSGISKEAPNLLNRLHRLRAVVESENGCKISTRDLIEYLGFEDVDEAFKPYTNSKEFNVEEVMDKMLAIAEEQGGKIYRKDLDDVEYRELLNYARRLGSSIFDIFMQYNIEYADYKKYKVFDYIFVDNYPYIDEMRKERDLKMAEFDKQNPGMLDTIRFEFYLRICKEIYFKYKDKIATYGIYDGFNEGFDGFSGFGK